MVKKSTVFAALLLIACFSASNLIAGDIEVSPEKILLAYKNNKKEADKQYKNKKITIKGMPLGAAQNNDGEPYIAFYSSNAENTLFCYFPKDKAGSLASLPPGKTVSVTCTAKGLDKSDLVRLDACVLNN